MLTEKDYKKISRRATELYSDLELEIIAEIAERIANVGYANTVVVNDIKIAQEAGVLYQDVIALVAKHNEMTENKVNEIFAAAGATAIKTDDRIYRKAGLNPMGMSPSMLQHLGATARKTHNNLSNLAMTTASTTQTQFYNAMNQAYMEVSTGVKSYSQAIIDAVNELSKQGAYIEYPSGQHRSIEAATRMNVLTSVNQTSGQLQLMRAEEMGWDLMELSAHSGARPEHAEWQGKVVSRSGQPGYLSLEDIGYGEVAGFQGVNCRHTWFPYYKGSTLTYSNKELEDLKNETVTYNGKEISKYDATQIQRRMERQIRKDKKDLAGLDGILRSNTDNTKLIEDTRTAFAKKTLYYKTHLSNLESYVSQTGMRLDNDRILTHYKYDTNKVGTVVKIANKYNNSKLVGTMINGPETTRITEIGEHVISRTYAREVSFKDVENILKNPRGYGKIKTDDKGRRSFMVYGDVYGIAVNPDTGKTATIRHMNKSERKRYGIDKDINR